MASESARVDSLLRRMSLDEKISQLYAAWYSINEDGSLCVRSLVGKQIASDTAYDLIKHGIGEITRPFGTHPIDISLCKQHVRSLQYYLVEKTRLGIPALFHEECLAGMMAKGTTQFPSGINYGSMWDPSLVRKIGEAIHREMEYAGIHQGLAPVLDVSHDLRWGRTEESMGEDPYLVGLTSCAYINGLQGPYRTILATSKHFLGHSLSEGGRNHAPVNIGRRRLYEQYALPFEMAVKLARCGSIMPAYHDIDGEPCSASKTYLDHLLRGLWGFDGIVVSDYEAISQLCHNHHVASDMAEAAALAVQAGIDVELPSDTAYREGLKRALAKNFISIEEVDVLVRRVLVQKYRLGLFDHPYGSAETVIVDSKQHHRLAIDAACASSVLLENNGILPLKQVKNIALIGPLADEPFAMYAGYSFPTHLIGKDQDPSAIPPQSLTVRKALERMAKDINIRYAKGCSILARRSGKQVVFPGEVVKDAGPYESVIDYDESGFGEAVDLARQADVAVVVLGDMAGLFRNGTVGEGSDAVSLELPGIQKKLLRKVLETNTPVVVVLSCGRPYAYMTQDRQPDAVLLSWMPGEGGGEAIAEMLLGLQSPHGRLPISYVVDAGMLPYTYNHYQNSAGVPKHPSFAARYPFGYGLSYSRFIHKDISVETLVQPTDGAFVIRCTVEHTGTYATNDVIQLYVRDVAASTVRPMRELKGFCNVFLDIGQSACVEFSLPVDMLNAATEDFHRIVEPGEFELMLGSSCEDVWFTQVVRVDGYTRILPQDWKMVTQVKVRYLN